MGRNSKARKEAEEKRRQEDALYRQRYEEELQKLSGKKRNWKRDILIFLCAIVLLLAIGCVTYLLDQSHASPEASEIMAVASPEGGAYSGVTVRTIDGNYQVFSPTSSAHAKVSDTGIIFYPGGKVEADAYAPLMHRLASLGFTVVLVNVPFNIAFFNANAADGVQAQVPEVSRWFLAGHSLGGVCASGYLANHADEYEGLIMLASYPSDDLSSLPVSALSIYGTQDGVMNRDNYESAKALMPADFQETVIQGGNHAQFGDYGQQAHDGDATISAQEQQRQTAEAILAFVNR